MTDVPHHLRARYHALWGLEHVVGATPPGARLAERIGSRKRAVHDRIVAGLKRGPLAGEPGEPDRVEGMGPEEFMRRYVRPGKPAILSGIAKDWPACRKWSPDYFAKAYGDYPLVVTNDYHQDRGGTNDRLSMTEYVAAIQAGDLRYARLQRILHDHPELLGDMDMDRLMRFKRRVDHVVASQFFFGPKTTETFIHCAFINNLFLQIFK